jgi:heme/copper-type cytochrome/quinol oxidase subunit 3
VRFDRIPAKMRLRRRLLILIRCQMRSVAGCYRFQPTERYEFAAAAKDAVLWCGSLNFFILLTSSLTIVLAINAAAQDERPNRMIRWLVVTLVLGAAFLGVKGYEYYLDFQDKVVPILDSEVKLGDGSAGELFWIFYWVATAVPVANAIRLAVDRESGNAAARC